MKRILIVYLLLIGYLSQSAVFGADFELPVVKNECVFSKNQFAFNLVFDVKYEKPEKKNSRQFYQITCSLEGKSCDGVQIQLDKNELSMFSVNSLKAIKLILNKGGTYKIKWGALRTFDVDPKARSIIFRESGSGITDVRVEGNAKVLCPI